MRPGIAGLRVVVGGKREEARRAREEGARQAPGSRCELDGWNKAQSRMQRWSGRRLDAMSQLPLGRAIYATGSRSGFMCRRIARGGRVAVVWWEEGGRGELAERDLAGREDDQMSGRPWAALDWESQYGVLPGGTCSAQGKSTKMLVPLLANGGGPIPDGQTPRPV